MTDTPTESEALKSFPEAHSTIVATSIPSRLLSEDNSTTNMLRSVPQTSSLESVHDKVKELQSRLEALMINTAHSASFKMKWNSDSSAYDPDWSQFASLQPEPGAPFFVNFLHTSPIIMKLRSTTPAIMDTYVHDGTIFYPFPRLPTELRLQIWELARPGPQIVRLKKKKNGEGVYSTAPIPGIMHACKESRALGLEKWYPMNNIWAGRIFERLLTFYFDPKNDFMFQSCEVCDSIYYCDHCRSLWPWRARKQAKRVMLRGVTRGLHRVTRFEPFTTIAFLSPYAKEVVFLSPVCPSGQKSDILLSLENLVESHHAFNWQKGSSFLDVSAKVMNKRRATAGSARAELWNFKLEKAFCMELAITPQTSNLYGFFEAKFEDVEIEELLAIPIPGARPLGMSYSTWRRLRSKAPRPAPKQPPTPLSEEELLRRRKQLRIDTQLFEKHTKWRRSYLDVHHWCDSCPCDIWSIKNAVEGGTKRKFWEI